MPNSSPQLIAPVSEIRTSNMLPDRSADVHFDPENEPSLTNQQFARECDINVIVSQFQKTGLVTHLANGAPQSGDFTDFGDSTYFQSAQNYLIEAQSAFDALPAEVRARFSNDPAKLLDFVNNQDNQDEAIKLGLAVRKPEEPIVGKKPSKKAAEAAPAEDSSDA